MVSRDLRERIGQNLVSIESPPTHRCRGTRFLVKHPVLEFHDEARDQEIEPAIYSHVASNRLSNKLKRPVDLGVPLKFRSVCETMEDLMLQLNREVLDWKDRFFFDALETDDDTLCSECKENMRVAFYATEDCSQTLKWKSHGDWCSHKECKYYTMYIFDELYLESNIRETPVKYDSG